MLSLMCIIVRLNQSVKSDGAIFPSCVADPQLRTNHPHRCAESTLSRCARSPSESEVLIGPLIAELTSATVERATFPLKWLDMSDNATSSFPAKAPSESVLFYIV